MRDYRFRGKRIDNGEWVYGQLCIIDNEPAIIVSSIKWVDGSKLYCNEFYFVDPDTIGQYTGVKEQYPRIVGEGKEIYFGDIVRLFGGEYCQGYYQYAKAIVIKSACDVWMLEESEYVQLLGNVSDNPELLKKVSI